MIFIVINDESKSFISFKQILINHSKRDLIYVEGGTGVGVKGGEEEEEEIINVKSFKDLIVFFYLFYFLIAERY